MPEECFIWDEATRNRCIVKLERDLNLAKELLQRLRYKRGHILELLTEIGQEDQGEELFRRAQEEWEAVEKYVTGVLEGVYARDIEVLKRYDPFFHVAMAQRAVKKTSTLMEFVRTEVGKYGGQMA